MRILVLCLAALAPAAAPAAATAESPSYAAAARGMNIVLILADDYGWADMTPNNPGSFYRTPCLERLAATGTRFTDGYAANPVCSPTRCSIMTGKYPTRLGLTSWLVGNPTRRFRGAPLATEMPLAEVTIAEALREQGYRTGFVGKWHLGGDAQFWPEHQGFDINIGGHASGSPRSYFSPYKNPRLTDGPPGEHLPKRLADEAMQMMDRWKDQPFFIELAFHSVHTPLQGRADLVEKYTAATRPASDADFADEEQVWPDAKARKVRIRQGNPVYAAMVEAMDEQIGRVIDKLDQLGLSERTLVIFTSDNGGLATSEGHATSNLPLRAGKGWLYEGGIRVPLLVRRPGSPACRVCSSPVISTDFYPTILEAAGVPLRPEQHLDGRSLLPLLSTEPPKSRRPLFWHLPHYANQGGFPGGAVRDGDWKLIERFEDGRVHLYNLATDLGERHDLAAEQPERVAALRHQLHRWYRETGANFLQPLEAGGPQPWKPEPKDE